MLKIFFNQEKGIALTIAVFVMIILFLIATALFISTQNESTNSMADTARMNSLMVSNSGAERAIWYVQQKFDNTPNWEPQDRQNLFTEEKPTVDCNKLVKEKDPEIYKMYGIGLTKPEGYSNLYGSQMRHENDPGTPEDEWAIYTVGVMRTPSLKLSSRKISVIKVLVKLGTTTSPFPDIDIMTGSDGVKDTWQENTRLRLFNPNRKARIVIPDGLDYNPGSIPGGAYRGKENDNMYYNSDNSIVDGMLTKIGAETQQVVFYSKKDIDTELTSIGGVSTSQEEINFPDLNLSIYEGKADYTAQQLTDKGVLVKQGNAYYLQKDIVIDNAGEENFNIPKNKQHPYDYARLVDKTNSDGLVIIYVPDGSLILRPNNWNPGRELTVGTDSHGMIVTRGKSPNYRFPFEDSLDPLVSDTGFQSFSFSYDPTPDELTKKGQSMWWEQHDWADIGKDINNNLSYIYDGNKEYNGLSTEPMKDELLIGTLDILSDYDIILSQPGQSDSGWWTSRFRGFIYSKGYVHLRSDLTQKGSTMAGKGIRWYDQGNLATAYKASGDGYDWTLYGESPLGRRDSKGEILFPYRITGGGGGGIRKFAIIAFSDVSSISKDIF